MSFASVQSEFVNERNINRNSIDSGAAQLNLKSSHLDNYINIKTVSCLLYGPENKKTTNHVIHCIGFDTVFDILAWSVYRL